MNAINFTYHNKRSITGILFFFCKKTIEKRALCNFFYEKDNWLGDVLEVISDRKFPVDDNNDGIVDYYKADVIQAQDYYPGGFLKPGRNFNSNAYRFGQNTQEKVDDISGVGNHYTAEFWEYDPRTIRRWNIDPVVKPWESPYACFNGNPIFYSDPTGLDGEGPNGECPGDVQICEDGTKEKYTAKGWEPASDPKTMDFSKSGVEFMKKQEGFVGHVYNDAKGANSKYYEENDHNVTIAGKVVVGKPTIAYGHLLTETENVNCVYENGITGKQGETLLKNDIKTSVDAVKSAVRIPLTQYEFDAIVDFTYNVGQGSLASRKGFKGSEFLKELNKGNPDAQLMMNYHKPVLVIPRRDDQINLFNTGTYTFRLYKYDKNFKRKDK